MAELLPPDFELTISPARRRKASIWRHAAGLCVLAFIIAAWAAFNHYTSGDRLRGFAEHMLADMTDGDVHVAAAEFDIFDGIHVSRVSIAVPEDAEFESIAQSRDEREVFSAGDVYLRFDPLRLLGGDVAVDEIVAVDPILTSVRRERDGRFNWQSLFTRPRRVRDKRPSWPTVRLRDATVRLYRIDDGTRVGQENYSMHALARPSADVQDKIEIQLWRAGLDRPDGRMMLDTETLALRVEPGAMPEVTFETARSALPAGVSQLGRWLDLLDLRGRIHGEDLQLDWDSSSHARIQLKDVALSIPLSQWEMGQPSDVRFMQLTDANGTIDFDGGKASLKADALIRGSPCSIDVEATGLTRSTRLLAELGLHAQVSIKRFELPEEVDDPRAAIGRLAKEWPAIRRIFDRFQPKGTLDVLFLVEKKPGADERIRLVHAQFEAHGVDALYSKFPYAMNDLRGTAVYDDEGLRFQRLVGRHGPSEITVWGTINDLGAHTAFDLYFDAKQTPLDNDLAEALREDHRRTFRRFNPEGDGDIRLHVWRGPPVDDNTPDRIKTTFDASLNNASASFDGFPYPVDDITGWLRLRGDDLVVEGVKGRRGDTHITVDGMVGKAGMKLKITAADAPVDETLLAALPRRMRAMVTDAGIEGNFNLAGRVMQDWSDDKLGFEFRTRLMKARVQHKSLPYTLTDVTGDLVIGPGRVRINNVGGRHDDVDLTLNGDIFIEENLWGGKILVQSPNLLLDESLQNALPESLSGLWENFTISGPVRLNSTLSLASAGGQVLCKHQTTIEANDNTLQLSAFPLPMTGIRGMVTINDTEAVFRELSAQHGDAVIELDGRMDLTAQNRKGSLTLSAVNMPMDEALRQAVPWRLRRMWNNIELNGRFNLELPLLDFSIDENKKASWTFQGQLDVFDTDFNIGLDAKHATGNLIGGGRIADGGADLTIDAAIDLDQIELNGRTYERVNGKLAYDDKAGRLDLTGLTGRIHSGQIAADCEVNFFDSATEYGLSLVVRDVALADLVNATRSTDVEPLEAKGTVSGNMFLSGVADEPNRLRGGGEVLISRAELFRLPLILDIAAAADVDPDVGETGQQSRAKFFLKGEQLNFERLEIRSGTVTLVGTGSLGMKNRLLDLTVLAVSPNDLPELPLLTELVQGATRELMEVKVEGTIDDPIIRTTPLRSVDAALRTLFQGSRASQQGTLDDE